MVSRLTASGQGKVFQGGQRNMLQYLVFELEKENELSWREKSRRLLGSFGRGRNLTFSNRQREGRDTGGSRILGTQTV